MGTGHFGDSLERFLMVAKPWVSKSFPDTLCTTYEQLRWLRIANVHFGILRRDEEENERYLENEAKAEVLRKLNFLGRSGSFFSIHSVNCNVNFSQKASVCLFQNSFLFRKGVF